MEQLEGNNDQLFWNVLRRMVGGRTREEIILRAINLTELNVSDNQLTSLPASIGAIWGDIYVDPSLEGELQERREQYEAILKDIEDTAFKKLEKIWEFDIIYNNACKNLKDTYKLNELKAFARGLGIDVTGKNKSQICDALVSVRVGSDEEGYQYPYIEYLAQKFKQQDN